MSDSEALEYELEEALPTAKKQKRAGGSAAGGGRTADWEIMEKHLSQGAVPMFIDPCRPAEFRADKPFSQRVPGGPLSASRLQWAMPASVPYRFEEDGGEPLDPVQSMLDDGLLVALSTEEWQKAYKTVTGFLSKGIRITKDTGCWIPYDEALSNARYREYFPVMYGYKVLTPKPLVAHNWRQARGLDLIELPRSEATLESGFWYGSYGLKENSLKPCKLAADHSHRCHDPLCCRPDHLCLELKIINDARKDCKGPGDDGICSCILAWHSTVGPELKSEFLRSISCLRAPKDNIVQRAPRGEAASSYVRQTNDPSTTAIMPGPYEPGITDVEKRSRMGLMQRKLFDTGFRFLLYPYAFVNYGKLVKFAKAPGEGVSKKTVSVRSQTWRNECSAEAMGRIGSQYAEWCGKINAAALDVERGLQNEVFPDVDFAVEAAETAPPASPAFTAAYVSFVSPTASIPLGKQKTGRK